MTITHSTVLLSFYDGLSFFRESSTIRECLTISCGPLNVATGALRTALRVVLVTTLGAGTAVATTGQFEKPCIMAAAEYLPRVPGIDIQASRTKPLPAEITAKLDQSIYHAIVELDAKAAGIAETYRFVCSAAAGGRPQITPLS